MVRNKVLILILLVIGSCGLYTNKSSGGDNLRTVSTGLVLVDIPKYRNLQPDSIIYNEILSYSKTEPFGDREGRSTNVHETVHGINSQLRNQYKNILKKNVNGFYAGSGKGVIVLNPNLTLRDIGVNIPLAVRGYRYNLYFVSQLADWNDVPTYPIDEWSAYISGAESAVDDHNRGLIAPKSDYVSGALEFSIYCTVLAMTVKEKDPEYWNNNEQFKHVIQYFLIKAERIFFKGQHIFPSEKQTDLLNQLHNHDDASKIRVFLLDNFQGVFID